MDFSKKPSFGPYNEKELILSFSRLSSEAFELFDETASSNWSQIAELTQHLFLRMAYQAKTTSLSIRLINSWALNLPALSLLRVRLEQLIVCSYLIHEDSEKGLKPFINYITVQRYRDAKAALSDEKIAAHLEDSIDIEALGTRAKEAQRELNPGFDQEEDKFQRKWTDLDLRSMAQRRDKLAAERDSICDHELERDYLSVYKTASSHVHADASSLSSSFLGLFSGPSNKPVLMAQPSWAFIVGASLSLYDILQCSEILRWLELPMDSRYKAQLERWFEARDAYLAK